MTTEILDQAVDLATHGLHPFHTQISGGEPFLVPALVTHVAQRIRQRIPSGTMGIQTNGTCLDEVAVDIIHTFDIVPGVSLDGDPKIQESIRGRSADTFKGLALLEKKKIPFNVTTVVSSANVDNLHRLVMALGSMAMARGIGLDLLVVKGRALNDAVLPASPARIREGILKMRRALDLVNRGRTTPLVVREIEKLQRLAPSHTSFCHAVRGQSLAVTPEGHLYPCSQTAYDPRFFLGSLDHPGSWPPSRGRNAHDPGLTQTLDQGNDCLACPLNGQCPGDCPSRLHYNRNQDPNTTCVLYRALADPQK